MPRDRELYFSDKFIAGSAEHATDASEVAAPCPRRKFVFPENAESPPFAIAALGFYEPYLNGKT